MELNQELIDEHYLLELESIDDKVESYHIILAYDITKYCVKCKLHTKGFYCPKCGSNKKVLL